MDFYEIMEGEGDDEKAVFLNMAHVVKVIDDDGDLVVYLTDGKSHQVANISEPEFLVFLKNQVHRTEISN